MSKEADGKERKTKAGQRKGEIRVRERNRNKRQ